MSQVSLSISPSIKSSSSQTAKSREKEAFDSKLSNIETKIRAVQKEIRKLSPEKEKKIILPKIQKKFARKQFNHPKLGKSPVAFLYYVLFLIYFWRW